MITSSVYKKIDPEYIGGNVVSILFRKSTLMKAMGQSVLAKARIYGAQANFMQNPYNLDVIPGIPITTRLQEAYSFQSNITAHAVESGVIYSDHIVLYPIKIDLVFEVSNWEKSDPKQALDMMETIYKERVPVDLMTEHKMIENMFLFSCQAETTVPEWGKLAFRTSFQQINVVNIEATTVKKEKVTATSKTSGVDVTKSIETPVDSGKITVRKSYIREAIEGIFNK